MSKTREISIVIAVVIGMGLPLFAWGSDHPVSPRQQKLNDGYYLLHKLAEDEAQIPLLLDIKHVPKELPPFGDDISRLSKETEAAIEKFSDKQSSLRYDHNPLPQIEQDVRDSIKSDKQHDLLGKTNSEFVRYFIISQIEAASYARNLCTVLADQEPDHARAAKLRQLGDKWLAMRERAFTILRDY